MGLERYWYDGSRWTLLLRPFSLLFRYLAARRRRRFARSERVWKAPVPVIIVGNISVGGSGKTPLTLYLIDWLREQGYRPGVVSRGYAAHPPETPFRVDPDSTAYEGGDEPLLIVRRTGVPLYIDPDRVAAAQALLSQTDCDVILSDDGLQHYALGRDLELAVIDGARGLGNGQCLPEGPLREPPDRLEEVDAVIINGRGRFDYPGAFHFELKPGALVSLNDGRALSPSLWKGPREVHAIAGIGNPSRFFETLRQLGFDPIEHPLPDHAELGPEMLKFSDERPVIMTEKDAVKCPAGALGDGWALRVDAYPDPAFRDWLSSRLKQLKQT
ncbi:MAG: tetraacyldisaccharide 4'-kinase [Oceanospirillaceae bacterium]|nr:tetraacyldisaccharide 4'-kinase [Oceanospirillaceae bacterium]